jgi:hypothetical protein
MSTNTWQLRDIRHRLQNDTLRFFGRPLEIFGNYRRENLRPDILAGLTVAVI